MKKYISFFNTPKVFFIYLFISLFLSFFLADFLGNTLLKKIIFFLIIFFIIIILTDFIFVLIYRFFKGYNYKFLEKIDYNFLTYEPHPYLPYVLKKKFTRKHGSGTMHYSLGKAGESPLLKTNNMRHYNGENGDRDVEIPKPLNLIRINCIGGSTTGNYVRYKDKNFSYPLELEKILKKKYEKKKIEVNNFGQGGNNSADILVKFILQGVDTKPDYLIIYHAYNDIKSYLTPNFSSDYFHSRKNLGEVYWKYYLGSKLPNVPINFINYFSNKYLFPLDDRSTLLEVISKNKIDMKQDYSLGLIVFKRNMQNIINLSLKNNIKVILGTFCLYIHPKIKDDPLHQLYKKIVSEENKIIKSLAEINKLTLVDCDSLIEKGPRNFVDSIHFSAQGMNELANCFADNINLN